MRLLVSLAVLPACALPADPPSFAGGAEPEAEIHEGSRRNVILTATPLIPGGEVAFTVSGANAYETVHIARSLQGLGAGRCFGSSGLLCLDMLGGTLHGSIVTDGDGVGTLVQVLPESLAIGRDAWFQAIVPRGASGASWVKSDVLAVALEDAALNVATMGPGDLILTEVMRDPAAVPDADGEWFEIHNNTGMDANLAGLEVTDFAGDTFTVSENVFVPAFGYAVLAVEADPALNGGVVADYAYTGMILGNGLDEIHLVASAGVIDSVAWDGGTSFPSAAGATMELDGFFRDAAANDVGVNWAAGAAPFGAGDLGTPGSAPGGVGRWFYTVNLDTDTLRRVDLDTLTFEDVGLLGVDLVHADLAWDARARTLYMVDSIENSHGFQALWTVDLETGVATQVGVHALQLAGLAYDPYADVLVASEPGSGLWEVERTTGLAALIGDPVGGEIIQAMTFDTTRRELVAQTLAPRDLVVIDPVAVSSTLLMPAVTPLHWGSLGYEAATDRFLAIDEDDTTGGGMAEFDPYGLGTFGPLLSGLDSHGGLVHVPYAP